MHQPLPKYRAGIFTEIDHPADAALLSDHDLDLLLVQIYILQPRIQQLPNAHTGAQQDQNDRTVAGMIDHCKHLLYRLRLDRPWQAHG